MPTVTPWNLPKSLLDALPESAGALARLAAEAYDVDPGTVDNGGDRRAEQHQVRRPPQSLVDLAEGSSPHAERVANLIGMRLQVEFSSYRLMEEMRHEVLVPAIDAGEGRLLSRCCSFLETLLETGDEELRDAVTLGVLESRVFNDLRWNALKSAAGPLLRGEMSPRT